MRRHCQRGFTLLELVLALAIVGAMLAIVFGGLRVGLRAWQRGEQSAESLQHARSLSVLLTQSLSGSYAYLGPTSEGSPLLFQGEADRVSFVTVSPPFPLPAPIAFTAVTLSVDEGERPGFAVREKALPNDEPFALVVPVVVDPALAAVRFRYLRDGAEWEDRWDGAQERGLPRAVEVTVTALVNGTPVEQPPLTISLRMTSP